MKKYLILAVVLALVLACGSVVPAYADENSIAPSGDPVKPTSTPVTYYPDYDEEPETSVAEEAVEVEEAVSPKTGDAPLAIVVLLLAAASMTVVACIRKARA